MINRVGDIGLAVALMVMFANIGSISFAGVFAAAPQISEGVLTAIGLLLLLGGIAAVSFVPNKAAKEPKRGPALCPNSTS